MPMLQRSSPKLGSVGRRGRFRRRQGDGRVCASPRCGKGGTYVVVGLFGGDINLSIPPIVLRAITIRGSYVGNLNELKELIALVQSGKVKPMPVETASLERRQRGARSASRRQGARTPRDRALSALQITGRSRATKWTARFAQLELTATSPRPNTIKHPWEEIRMNRQVKQPNDAAAPVRAQHAATIAELPFSDRADFADAARGFLGTRENAHVVNDKGRVVWSLQPYGFLAASDAPHTVNPSLWRQSQLNMHHGLFEVVPGVYQVRGFDIANMTLIEGDSGVIVVDCLTSIEGARAAVDLYFQHRGKRPVTGLIITHTHGDHWGGVRGVISDEEIASGQIPIIAPDLFMENAVSENVIAGPAMQRRAHYQFGHFLAKGARGHVDCGLGKTMALGSLSLVRPNDLIKSTGDTRMVDGIAFEFQMAPESEAPAEMHFFVPRYKLLNLAENCTHNFHNLLPFRGAEVRNTLAWSRYLAEALHMWGGKADAMCGQHHWPVWGTERITTMIRQQRDLYKFAHDQTVRLINHGLNAAEIAETIQLPASLEGAWHGRGYYGHIRHNVKAIYQKYLGWYDANPANLDPLPQSRGRPKVRGVHGRRRGDPDARATGL